MGNKAIRCKILENILFTQAQSSTDILLLLERSGGHLRKVIKLSINHVGLPV